MGLFKRKKKKEVGQNNVSSLPELPELPEYSRLETKRIQPVSKLPQAPPNFPEEKFSQNKIDETVSGEEGDKEAWKADDFAREQEMQMMQKPLKEPITQQYTENIEGEKEIPEELRQVAEDTKKVKPLFIRIDKFEESLKTFKKIKEKVLDIDKLLKEVKEVKEKEEGELNLWEEKIQTIKKQIEKIDKNIFSRV
jgi:hypothetical protein